MDSRAIRSTESRNRFAFAKTCDGFIYLVEDHHHRLLDDFVLQSSNAQRTLPPVGLRYIDSS